MKKPHFLLVILGITLLFASSSYAADFSQSATLKPGWNIVSTPRVLESHSFSVPETSDNFDIFILDASSVSGWSTMAALGQTEFEPLFGYFINNKTGDNQTLTFNYKSGLPPNEKLFQKTFSKTGWYSIGVANPTYSKQQCSTIADSDNPSKILDSLVGSHSSVIDFTDVDFEIDRNSVAVASSWKSVVPSDLNNLNDFRDLKAYAIFITKENALYSGFQNDTAPNDCLAPVVTVSKANNSPADFIIIGTNDAPLARFSLTAQNQDVKLTRLNFTAMVSNPSVGSLRNARVMINGNQAGLTQSLSATDTTFFDIDYTLLADQTITVEIRADIFDDDGSDDFGNSDQIQISLVSGENNAHDVISTYFLNVPDENTYGNELTLQSGVLTITFVGPNAANIGTNTSDTVFLRYTMFATTNIEVRKTKFTWCWDNAGDGIYNDAADAINGFADVLDVKVIDENTGAVVMGPHDGSAFTTSQAGTCPNGATGASKQFTDVFDLPAGVIKSYKVTADVITSNGSTNANLADGDKIKLVLENYADDMPDITVMKYTGTNTAVADTEIVPNADISGPNMTLQGSSLTLGLSASPVDDTYVKGTSNVDAVGITFKASAASALKVTDVTLTGYKGAASGTGTIGSLGELIASVALYDGETGALISSSPSSNNLGAAAGTVVFNGLAWNIPAGQTKTLLVRVNLSTNEPAAAKDFFSFDIVATTDVTALDSSDGTVNASAASVAPNGTTSPNVDVGVTSAGSLAVAAAPGNPTVKSLYWGQTGAEASRFRFTSTNEAFYLENLVFEATNPGEVTDFKANVKKVTMSYKNQAGNTLTAVALPVSTGSVSFGLSGLGANRPYVPKDSSLDVSLSYEMKIRTEGATGNDADNEASFSLDFDGGDAPTTDFKAIGAGSGTTLAADATGIADVAGTNMYTYRVFPKFTNLSTSSGGNAIGGNKEVVRFTITAMGLPDSKLFFDGGTNLASGTIIFDVVASGQANSNMELVFYGADDNLVYGTDDLDAAQGPLGVNDIASLSFGTSQTGRDLEISGGESKTIYATTTFAGFATNGDSFQLVLRDEAGQVKWVSNSDVNDSGTSSIANALQLLPLNGTSFTTTGL